MDSLYFPGTAENKRIEHLFLNRHVKYYPFLEGAV
jgi:hypothetical protein